MSISSLSYFSLAWSGSVNALNNGGKISVLVSPQTYIYSHLRHVAGTPAPEGQGGANLSNLRILDIMIDKQLTRLREWRSSHLDFKA